METYNMTVNASGTSAVKRIRNPHPHDVLCGRGGGCNSFAGNCAFREFVKVRKNRYNLAPTKAEKARVANEVIDLVRNQNPPGRFLQRDPTASPGSAGWWIECDEAKAMAKTSQALREGAPSIRAAHKDELDGPNKRKARKRRTRTKKTDNTNLLADQSPTPTTGPTPLLPVGQMPPLNSTMALQQLKTNVERAAHEKDQPVDTSNTSSYAPVLPAQNMNYENFYFTSPRPAKKAKTDHNTNHNNNGNSFIPPSLPNVVHPEDETPPLQAMPAPVPLNSISPMAGDEFPQPAIPNRSSISSNNMHRANSLALSDLEMAGLQNWGDVEFVNPFDEEETDLIGNTMPSPSPMMTPPPERSNGNGNGNNGNHKYLSNTNNNNRNSARAVPRNSIDNGSNSELSDLNEDPFKVRVDETDFTEGMKAVYDAAHPGLATPNADEIIPTHLYPFHHSGGSGFNHHHHHGSNSNNSSPKLIMSS